MIKFVETDTRSVDYRFVEQLLHSAFPEEERRSDAEQRVNTDQKSNFHCLTIYHDNALVGVITYWQLCHFRYVEHFAIAPDKRNGGIGAKALKAFVQLSSEPVVLEVEPPEMSLIARRRIEFYRRCGFLLWQAEYMQPPYRKDGASLPLKLMATASLQESHDYENVRSMIHCHVYGKHTY